jgi:hypothetical protein
MDMTPNQQQELRMKEKEKPQPVCRACKTQVKHTASAQGAVFVLCPIHAAAVRFDRRAQEVVRVVAADVAQERVVLVHDADGAGWGHPVPPKPPRPAIVGYDDDGFVRLRDTASPHGQTIRPEVDTLIGDDPRLDRYRIKELDDGQQ